MSKKRTFTFLNIFIITILFVLIFPFMLYLYLTPAYNEKVSYGLNFSNKYASELDLDWKNTFQTILKEIPTKKFRLAVYWDEVQKNPDTYDFSNIKYQLNELEKFPESEVILVIGRKVIRYPECHEPGWWKEIRDEGQKREKILQLVTKTVEELKNYKSIKYWQVENEVFFPFGECTAILNIESLLKEEVEIVRKLDPERKILIQDSGEGGFWIPSKRFGDYLGISIYRKVWFDFFGTFTYNSFPVKYPLGSSFYKMKAFVLGIPFEKIKATEVQAEPWGPVRNYLLRNDEVDATMSPDDFLRIFQITKESGFLEFHLWGVEWWYHMKNKHNQGFYWNTAIEKIK